MIYLLRAALGVAFFCVVAWLMSNNKRRFPWRTVFWGIAIQVALAVFILWTKPGNWVFQKASDIMVKLTSMTEHGAGLVFGKLAYNQEPLGVVFAFAGKGLTAIIFFSALFAILYHLGVMQVIVWVLARVMTAFMGVSAAESMSVASDIFLGQTEAPLAIKPYISRMTLSELNAMMTGGFATIAGSVLAIYLGFLGPEYGKHLLTASVMSAPAAFVMAKIIRPESDHPETSGHVPLKIERTAHNLFEAAANGTSDGLKLWLNVLAMLIAFTALIYLADWPLQSLGEWCGISGGLSLARIFGWVFAPVAWIMGVDGWHDCNLLGSLLGTKIALNEFVAYDQLQHMLPGSPAATQPGGVVFEHSRSVVMATYALCGFANFASIGIQIGGVSQLAPDRKTDLSRLALKAMLGGAFATCMTAIIAGVFVA